MPWLGVNESQSMEFVDPYEIWSYYRIQGGVVFVFEDQDGFSDFRLVHSNADAEIYSAAWNDAFKDNLIELE